MTKAAKVATTLSAIRVQVPTDEWEQLLAHLGKTQPDDEALPLSTVMEAIGFNGALSGIAALPPEHESWARLVICDMADRALRFVPLAEGRPRWAVATARRFARGEATHSDLFAARRSAWAAAKDCVDATRDAREAEYAAADKEAARIAVKAARAAEHAARAAAWVTERSVKEIVVAARRAAMAAESAEEERTEQEIILRAALETNDAGEAA